MKNKKIILIFILMLAVSNMAFAMDFYPEFGNDPFYSTLNPENVPDDSEGSDTVFGMIKNKKKQKNKKQENNNILNSEKDVTKNDDSIEKGNIASENTAEKNNKRFFILNKEKKEKKEKVLTPAQRADAATREEKLKEKEKEKQFEKTTTFKDKFFIFKKKEKITNEVPENPSIELSADYMEYYPERYEIEAVGNAKIIFKKDDTSLSANKLIFNYDRNVLKASENVVLISKDSVTEGDFIKLDLNQPEGWIENPVTSTEDIKLSAKEAFIYSDRIEENEGVAKIIKNEVLRFGSTSFDSYVDQGQVFQNRIQKDTISSGVYSLKARTIYIDSKKDHEIITVKNADLYLKNHKIASIPSARIVSNKQNTNIETNIPEFGSQNKLGMYLGPAVVLNVPGGSTLKLAPILTYGKDDLGIGGIARFRSETNLTEAAYGTSHSEFILRGKQKLAPGLTLNYSRYTNQNEWFLGYRMPKYGLNLTYSRNDNIDDLKLRFSQMYSAGLYVDNPGNLHTDFNDAEGRFRWMTQTYKPFYNYSDPEGNIGVNVGLVAQTMASVYTTGDVAGLFRIGPSLRTKVGPWQQSLIYYQTAIAGQSPFEFDRYRYGRSNLVLIESLKLCKYLSLGYLASVSMNREVSADDLLQENRILLSVGPDYAKLTIGYDSVRRNTMFVLSMLVGTKNSDIEFKKSIIKNPQNIGNSNVKTKKDKRKNYKKYMKENA